MSAAEAPPIARPLGAARTPRLDLRPIGPGNEALLAPVFAKLEVWRFPYGRGCTRRQRRGSSPGRRATGPSSASGRGS